MSMIPDRVTSAAATVNRLFLEAGIPHCFIGGLAVSAYGYARMTEDVDVLVNKRDLGKIDGRPMAISGKTFKVNGVDVDVISPPGRADFFAAEIDAARGGLISFPGLVLLKIMAERQKDLADLVELAKVDPARTQAVVPYLKGHQVLTRPVWETIQEVLLAAEKEMGGARRKNPQKSPSRLLGGRYRAVSKDR